MLAHTGGFSWDEGLFVAVPLVVLALLALAAARRQRAEPPVPDDRA